MAEFLPVSTAADMALQHDDDLAWGMAAGRRGDPEPLASTFSRAYWQGWRAGRFEAGTEPDLPQRLLAHECLATFGEDGPFLS